MKSAYRKINSFGVLGAITGGIVGMILVAVIYFGDSILNFSVFADSFVIINILFFMGVYIAGYFFLTYFNYDRKDLDYKYWFLFNILLAGILGTLIGYFLHGVLLYFILGFVIGSAIIAFLTLEDETIWLGYCGVICCVIIWLGLSPIYDAYRKVAVPATGYLLQSNSSFWLIRLPLFFIPLFVPVGYLIFRFVISILVEKKDFQSNIQNYKLKAEDWKKDGFDLSEIEKVLNE
jgi:hypothetical protein